MTVNIISTQVNRNSITGPKKVLENTLKGFDKLNIKYVFNQPINKYKFNWIHDSQEAIIEAGFVGKPVLVGPNTAVLPKDLPIFRKQLPTGSIYLHPSKWTIDLWSYLGYSETKLNSWPVGIDITEFNFSEKKVSNKVLLYFKQRDLIILDKVKEILKKLGLEYVLIHYGFYEELVYKKALKECKIGIWIGCSESQGIGLQEALATNLPLIVIDSESIHDAIMTDSKKYFGYSFREKLTVIKTTSAPYFDKRCGIIINSTDYLTESITTMLSNIKNYKPREYIEETLTLEKSANSLIVFFNQMGIKDNKSYNYQKVSKVLFYLGLLFQKWAWKWIWRKFIR